MRTSPKTAQGTKKKGDGPDPIDIHAGGRLRMLRNLAGMSQEQLAKAAGLTFQQIQKYERGSNRMGASRIFQFAGILNASLDWAFQGMEASKPALGFSDNAQAALDGAPGAVTTDDKIMTQRETLELVRAYYGITDPKQRRKVYELIKSMRDI